MSRGATMWGSLSCAVFMLLVHGAAYAQVPSGGGGDTTPPTAPTGLTATAASSVQINLVWTASTDNVAVAGYRVERCQGATCTTFAQVATPTATNFSDTGRTAATTYRYRVRATDGAGNLGAFSAMVAATTQAADATPPTAPSSLTATAVSASQINLSWTASTDNVGVAGYRVERCLGVNCTTFAQVAAPTATSFSDAGLTAATTYGYRVRSTDAAGNLGAYSPIASATTTQSADTTPPTAPSGLTATVVNATQVNLNWTASTDNVGATGYRVERCQGANCTAFAQVAAPTGTSFGDTGLAAATYSYRVRATDAAGNLSGYSTTVSATVSVTAVPLAALQVILSILLDDTAMSAPIGLTAAAASISQINLSWTATVGAAGYQVERCQGAGCTTFAQIATPTATSFNDTGLTAGTSYSYRVRATDAAGNLSDYSNIASDTPHAVQDITPPTAPSALNAVISGSNQVNLTWAPSTDNVAVTGYEVDRCQGAGCSTFVVAGTSFSDTGLSPGTNYSYRVRAVDAAGNVSVNSNTVSVTTQAGAATNAVQAYYIYPDHLNTPRLIESASATAAWRWDQGEPFGNDVPNNNPSGQGAFEFNLRFPGQYADRETNLAYNNFRDYDPAIGRYVQSDPIGLRGGFNLYVYVGGRPMSLTDALGLYCLSDAWIGGIAGGVGGAFGGAITGFLAGGIPGALAIGALGLGAGALTGALADSQYNAIVGGTVAGGLGGANAPFSGALGGLVGGTVADFAQSSGLSSGTSMIVGGGSGGAVGGAVASIAAGTAVGAGLATGGLIGLSSAALTAGIREALKAGNDCSCGQK